jgi:hypothetical protein
MICGTFFDAAGLAFGEANADEDPVDFLGFFLGEDPVITFQKSSPESDIARADNAKRTQGAMADSKSNTRAEQIDARHELHTAELEQRLPWTHGKLMGLMGRSY